MKQNCLIKCNQLDYYGFIMHTTQLGEHIQFGIFATVSCITADQAVATKLLNSYSTVDLCSIIQSVTVCVSVDCNAVLHLFGGRNAGKNFSYG